MSRTFRNVALGVFGFLLLLALFTLFQNPERRPSGSEISFSQFLTEVDQGRVRDVLIQGSDIHGNFTDGRAFQTYVPNDPTLIQRLYGKNVSITARNPPSEVPWFVSLVISWLPFILLIWAWMVLIRILRRIQLAVEKMSDQGKAPGEKAQG
jgi:cell division protease FtsH